MSLKIFISDVTAASKSNSAIVNIKWVLFNHTLHLLFLFRLGQALSSMPFIGRVISFFIEYIIRVLYASDISCRASIGKGCVIVHGHDIVIGADVIIGENCRIFNGVTLGNKDITQESKGNQPIVGNNVLISTGAKLLGPIKIGDNVEIGANSVVIKDCPSNTVIAGIPGRVVKVRL